MAKKQKNYDDVMNPFVFPAGTTRFSHLTKPDEYEGKVEYKVEVVVDDSKEWEETLKKLKDFQDDRDLANGKSTKSDLTCLKSKDGKRFLKFHSKSAEFFSVVDKNNHPYSEEPWMGSTVRVFGQPEYYTGFGGGVTLYLNKVQVVENTKDAGGSTSREDPFANNAPAAGGEDPFKGI